MPACSPGATATACQDWPLEARRPEPHAIDAESGRGLELVSILSDRWGVRYPETGGKVVWARLPTYAGAR